MITEELVLLASTPMYVVLDDRTRSFGVRGLPVDGKEHLAVYTDQAEAQRDADEIGGRVVARTYAVVLNAAYHGGYGVVLIQDGELYRIDRVIAEPADNYRAGRQARLDQALARLTPRPPGLLH